MPSNPSPDGVELIERIIRRDQNALTELYNRYGRLVHNMAFGVLKNQSAAEEVTQDVFFQVWRWPEKWDPEKGQFTSWILSVTRYTAIDRLRRESRQPTLAPEALDKVDRLLGQRRNNEEAHRDNQRLLRGLLMQLPKEQRQMIYLAFFRGMTHQQIAEHLDLPLGTVKSRVRLGLEKLREEWILAVKEPE